MVTAGVNIQRLWGDCRRQKCKKFLARDGGRLVFFDFIKKQSAGLFFSAALCFGGSFSAVSAQDVLEIDVRGEFKATYSDNVNLVQTGKQGGLVLNASPGLNIRYKTGRTEASFDYWLDYYRFLYDGSSEVRHSAFATLDSEVIKDHFFLRGRAGVQQEFLDRTGGFSNSDANRSANRRTVQNYSLSGSWQSRVLDLANFTAGYEYGQVLSPADNLEDDTLTVNFSDTVSHTLNAVLTSGKRYQKFEWFLRGRYQRVEKSLVDDDFEEWNYGGELWYKPNRHIAVMGGYSFRGNKAQTDKLSLNTGGVKYGVRLQPGPKLTVSAEREELSADRTYDTFSLYYQMTKRIVLQVNHIVDFSSNALGLADRIRRLSFEDRFGIDDGTGVPIDDSDIAFSLTDIDFEQFQWNGSLRWRHKRDRVFISGNRERRVFDADIEDSRSWGGALGWERNIDRMTTFSITGSYRKNIIDGGERIDEYRTLNMDWQRTLSRYFKMAFQFSRTDRKSSVETGNLRENALTFYLRGSF